MQRLEELCRELDEATLRSLELEFRRRDDNVNVADFCSIMSRVLRFANASGLELAEQRETFVQLFSSLDVDGGDSLSFEEMMDWLLERGATADGDAGGTSSEVYKRQRSALRLQSPESPSSRSAGGATAMRSLRIRSMIPLPCEWHCGIACFVDGRTSHPWVLNTLREPLLSLTSAGCGNILSVALFISHREHLIVASSCDCIISFYDVRDNFSLLLQIKSARAARSMLTERDKLLVAEPGGDLSALDCAKLVAQHRATYCPSEAAAVPIISRDPFILWRYRMSRGVSDTLSKTRPSFSLANQAMRSAEWSGNEIIALAAAPSLELFALGSMSASVLLLHSASGTLARTLNGAQASITCLLYCPQQRVLVAGSVNGSVCLWHADSGHVLQHLSPHKSAIRVLTLLHSKLGVFASAEEKGIVKTWECWKDFPLQELDISSHLPIIESGCIDSKGVLLGGKQIVRLSFIEEESLSTTENFIVDAMVMSLSLRQMFTAAGGRIRAWDLATGKALRSIPDDIFTEGMTGPRRGGAAPGAEFEMARLPLVTSIALDGRSRRVIAAEASGACRVYSALNGQLLNHFPPPAKSNALLVCRGAGCVDEVWLLVTSPGQRSFVFFLKVIPCHGRSLASGGNEERVESLTGLTTVTACALSPNLSAIACGDTAGNCHIFPAHEASRVRPSRETLHGHEGEITCLIYLDGDQHGVSVATSSQTAPPMAHSPPLGLLSADARGVCAIWAVVNGDGTRMRTADDLFPDGEKPLLIPRQTRMVLLAQLHGHMPSVYRRFPSSEGAVITAACTMQWPPFGASSNSSTDPASLAEDSLRGRKAPRDVWLFLGRDDGQVERWNISGVLSETARWLPTPVPQASLTHSPTTSVLHVCHTPLFSGQNSQKQNERAGTSVSGRHMTAPMIEQCQRWQAHKGAVGCVLPYVSPTAPLVISGGKDKSVRLWHADPIALTIPPATDVQSAVLSPALPQPIPNTLDNVIAVRSLGQLSRCASDNTTWFPPQGPNPISSARAAMYTTKIEQLDDKLTNPLKSSTTTPSSPSLEASGDEWAQLESKEEERRAAGGGRKPALGFGPPAF